MVVMPSVALVCARAVCAGAVAPPPQGSRPPCLGEPRGPQARIQQRTMEQLADVVPMVQILDIPVPQMVEQLPDVLRFFATLLPVPEQVIEVPKIVLDYVPVRTAVRFTQLAEQLVKCRRLSPILTCSGLWSSTLTFQFLVVEGHFWSSRCSSRIEFNSAACFSETHF